MVEEAFCKPGCLRPVCWQFLERHNAEYVSQRDELLWKDTVINDGIFFLYTELILQVAFSGISK